MLFASRVTSVEYQLTFCWFVMVYGGIQLTRLATFIIDHCEELKVSPAVAEVVDGKHVLVGAPVRMMRLEAQY